MKIQIPHLAYTVHLKDKFRKDMSIPCCEKINSSNCILWIPKKYQKQATVVSHEVVHVLQFIAEARGIDMILEQEHIAYLMSYIVSKIFNTELVAINK